MAVPKRKRVSRRQQLKQPDEFITKSAQVIDFASDNRRALGIGLAAFLLVVILVLVGRDWQTQKVQTQADAFNQGILALATPVGPPDEPADPNPTDPTAAPPEPEFRFGSLRERATEVMSAIGDLEAGSSGSGALVTLAKATAHADLGETDTAIAGYRAFLGGAAGEELKFFALDGLVVTLMDKGEHEAALAETTKLGALKGGAYADHAAFTTARILEAKGEADKAREAYRAFLEAHAESALKGRAQKRLDLLGG